jgi:hypothetical protein
MSEQKSVANIGFTRKPEFELHPAGTWKCALVEMNLEHHDKFGEQVKFTLETEVVDEDSGKERRMNFWAKPSLHPKSKVTKMLIAMGVNVEAIPDEDLQPDEEGEVKFKLTDYLNKRFKIQVAHEPKKDAPKEMRDVITGFLPLKSGGAVATSSKYADEDEKPAAAKADKPAAEKKKSEKPAEPEKPATGSKWKDDEDDDE